MNYIQQYVSEAMLALCK